jgi:hypothetical protein
VVEFDGLAVAECFVPQGAEVTAALEDSVVAIRRADDGDLLATGLTPI